MFYFLQKVNQVEFLLACIELWSGGFVSCKFLNFLCFSYLEESVPMPQLDVLTLLDQFLAAYVLFVTLHFFISVGPIPTIFEVLYTRHLLFVELVQSNVLSTAVVAERASRSNNQQILFYKLINNFLAQ